MKPHLFIIIDSEILGGPGRGLLLFLKHVRCRELSYTLVNFDRPGRKSGEFIEAARSAGHELHLLREQFRFDPSTIIQAFKLFRARGANVVQSHGYKSHILALLISKRFGIPWVSFSHGWTAEDAKVRIYNKIERLLVRAADHSVVVSPVLQRSISAIRGVKPTELIMNAVDPDEIPGIERGEDIRRRHGWGRSHVIIGCFGRLSREKGQDILLRAFAGLAPSFPMVRLLLVGDGVMREKLSAQAAVLGIADRVAFAGHQSAIRGYYESIDLLVLPSRSEGLPNVMLEAMALGVPVLATQVGAVPEVIEDSRTGWTIPAEDPEALEAALKDICASPERRAAVAEAAAQEVTINYSARARAELLLKLYNRLLSPEKPVQTWGVRTSESV